MIRGGEPTLLRACALELTGAIEARCDGVQEGVLGGQEALHHRHGDPWCAVGLQRAEGHTTISGAVGKCGQWRRLAPAAGEHIYSEVGAERWRPLIPSA